MVRNPTKQEVYYIQGLLFNVLAKNILPLFIGISLAFCSAFFFTCCILYNDWTSLDITICIVSVVVFLIGAKLIFNVTFDRILYSKSNWRRMSLLNRTFDVIDITVDEYAERLKRPGFDNHEVWAYDKAGNEFRIKHCLGLCKKGLLVRLKHKNGRKFDEYYVPAYGESDYYTDLANYNYSKYLNF